MENYPSTIHISVANFNAAVAMAKEPSLKESAFVIAKESSRSLVLDLSKRALDEGIYKGMLVKTALQRVPSLKVITPDPVTSAKVDSLLIKLASKYTPLIASSGNGNLFLDVRGTRRLFGEPVDCALRLQNSIYESLTLASAIAVASNRVVAKVGTRAIMPKGIAEVKAGSERAFLAHQDISLLPGVGGVTVHLLKVAGFNQIGQLAQLNKEQVVTLLGKRGIALRDAARGLDFSYSYAQNYQKYFIKRDVSFKEPLLNSNAILAALVAATEEASLEMRTNRLSTKKVEVKVYWGDGAISIGSLKAPKGLYYENEVVKYSELALERGLNRRIRVVALSLKLDHLEPFIKEFDLFESTKNSNLQKALDQIRERYNVSSITSGATLFHE